MWPVADFEAFVACLCNNVTVGHSYIVELCHKVLMCFNYIVKRAKKEALGTVVVSYAVVLLRHKKAVCFR